MVQNWTSIVESNWIFSKLYLYIYTNKIFEKIQLDSTIEIQFCVMCPKLFIFRESFVS